MKPLIVETQSPAVAPGEPPDITDWIPVATRQRRKAAGRIAARIARAGFAVYTITGADGLSVLVRPDQYAEVVRVLAT